MFFYCQPWGKKFYNDFCILFMGTQFKYSLLVFLIKWVIAKSISLWNYEFFLKVCPKVRVPNNFFWIWQGKRFLWKIVPIIHADLIFPKYLNRILKFGNLGRVKQPDDWLLYFQYIICIYFTDICTFVLYCRKNSMMGCVVSRPNFPFKE